jgi:NADH-quinone oxidoreductase subunit J
MFEAILFYLLGGGAALLALLTITMKNPIHNAVSLIWHLVCVAGLFALLGASFLSVIQVLIYAGAILVLFVFVIMLLNLSDHELGSGKKTLIKHLAAASVLAFLLLGAAALVTRGGAAGFPELPADGFGSVAAMGRLLFGAYLLPFEVVSVVLFAAILGAVALAKKELW